MDTKQIIGAIFALVGIAIVAFMSDFIGSSSPVTMRAAQPMARPMTVKATAQPTARPVIVEAQSRPIVTAEATQQPLKPAALIVFDDVVPSADSPEMSSEIAQACFSQYSRDKNLSEHRCLGEWYPADMRPRPGDDFWCASNGPFIEWVPIRFYTGRGSQTVEPTGKPDNCQ
jgi:hypothetical protein